MVALTLAVLDLDDGQAVKIRGLGTVLARRPRTSANATHGSARRSPRPIANRPETPEIDGLVVIGRRNEGEEVGRDGARRGLVVIGRRNEGWGSPASGVPRSPRSGAARPGRPTPGRVAEVRCGSPPGVDTRPRAAYSVRMTTEPTDPGHVVEIQYCVP